MNISNRFSNCLSNWFFYYFIAETAGFLPQLDNADRLCAEDVENSACEAIRDISGSIKIISTLTTIDLSEDVSAISTHKDEIVSLYYLKGHASSLLKLLFKDYTVISQSGGVLKDTILCSR